MVRRACLRVLSSSLALLMLVGCSGSSPEENAECSQDATRELVCGRYGTGVQQQVCGPRFRWINDGECQDSTVCEHDAVREKPCEGLNGNAYQQQSCKLGFWPDEWSSCIDPDDCTNGEEIEFICDGGLNDRATQTHLCEQGQWVPSGECVDPDACTLANAKECDANATCHDLPTGAACRCDAGFDGDGVSCTDRNECAKTWMNGCDEAATCTNEPGSYRCTCPKGWLDARADGTSCEAFNHVTVGAEHTCAQTVDRVLYCWGNNDSGQLGDGSSIQRNVPKAIASTNRWSTVEAGGHYTRGRVNLSSRIYKWGGDAGVAEFADIPSYSTGLSIVLQSGLTASKISVGYGHTCVLAGIKLPFKIQCWGLNTDGQLGIGSLTSKETPTDIDTMITGWLSVSAGGRHTCGLTSDSRLYCWGRGQDGQLGRGVDQSSNVPEHVIGNATAMRFYLWSQVSAGESHTCAIASDPSNHQSHAAKGLYCWGANGSGQLGINTTTSTNVPTRVSDPHYQWDYVSSGAQHTCGITTTGALYCWGKNEHGQLGDSTTTQSLTPKRIGTATNWVQVRAGREHTCGLNDTGGIYCWGDNRRGQLGTPGLSRREKPTPL